MREEAMFLPYNTAAASTAQEEDHPLFMTLCEECRKGDVQKVKFLVETEEVPINRRDKWDCVPLYYAALCGHVDLVKYLLQAGAHCDPNTFEGERCLYGALTDEIRNILRASRLTKAIDTASDYALFTYALWSLPQDHCPDISFNLPHAMLPPSLSVFPAHRVILSARSPFFLLNLLMRWSGSSNRMVPVRHHRVHPQTLRATLLYLYTGQAARDVPPEQLEDWVFLCKQWKMSELVGFVQDMIKANADERLVKSKAAREAIMVRDVRGVQRDIGTLLWWILHAGKRWVIEEWWRIKRGQAVVAEWDVAGAMDKLASFKDRTILRLWGTEEDILAANAAPDRPKLWAGPRESTQNGLDTVPPEDIEMGLALLTASDPDVIVEVAGTHFPCHRAFLQRSEYFGALLSGRFAEAHDDFINTKEPHPPTKIDLTASIPSPEVFGCILEFIYTDRTTLLSATSAHATLETADLLLLPRLTSRVQTYIISLPYLPSPGPYALLRTAWALNLHRLEQHVTRHFAREMLTEGKKDDFRELIRESAESIVSRQETDTVIFVDDLRFWLARECGIEEGEEMWEDTDALVDEGVLPASKLEYVKRMRVLEDILEGLGIDM
ncbi:Ankyrin repeat and BTB/POZ domain-containing protein 1 [Rhizophlyctis rosea]|nr:Ankyrin repeat and BTB/POZ domain-containing protein 1 [Rhizophlyctis rosea]